MTARGRSQVWDRPRAGSLISGRTAPAARPGANGLAHASAQVHSVVVAAAVVAAAAVAAAVVAGGGGAAGVVGAGRRWARWAWERWRGAAGGCGPRGRGAGWVGGLCGGG